MNEQRDRNPVDALLHALYYATHAFQFNKPKGRTAMSERMNYKPIDVERRGTKRINIGSVRGEKRGRVYVGDIVMLEFGSVRNLHMLIYSGNTEYSLLNLGSGVQSYRIREDTNMKLRGANAYCTVVDIQALTGANAFLIDAEIIGTPIV